MSLRLRQLGRLPIWVMATALAVVPLLAVFGLTGGGNEELNTVSGVLGRCGTGYCVGDSVADFGQQSNLRATESEIDFDGNGTIETLAEELDGLVGQQVTLEVERGPRDVEVDVINGLEWRERRDAAPPGRDDVSETTDQPAARPPPPPGDGDEGAKTSLDGTLTRCGDEYCIDEVLLHFGPWWYVQSTRSDRDVDGDGTVETLAQELDGLVGQQVALDIKAGPRDADVYAVNGVPWRESDGGPPPWAGGPLRRNGPDNPPPPDDPAPPDDPGPPGGPGPPEDPGPPDDRGPPDDAGLPGGAGPPGG